MKLRSKQSYRGQDFQGCWQIRYCDISRIVCNLGVIGFSCWKVMLHVQKAENMISNELKRVKFSAVRALALHHSLWRRANTRTVNFVIFLRWSTRLISKLRVHLLTYTTSAISLFTSPESRSTRCYVLISLFLRKCLFSQWNARSDECILWNFTRVQMLSWYSTIQNLWGQKLRGKIRKEFNQKRDLVTWMFFFFFFFFQIYQNLLLKKCKCVSLSECTNRPDFALISGFRSLRRLYVIFTTCTNPIIHLFNPPKICIGIVFYFP